MVVSEIRSLYREENHLFRTALKRIYENWEAEREQWHLKWIEFLEFPVPSENLTLAVEQRHGWLIPSEWEFPSEVWKCERKSRVSKTVCWMDARFVWL